MNAVHGRRRLARATVAGLVAMGGLQFATRERTPAPAALAAAPSLELPPLWRQPADLLEQTVPVGPVRTRNLLAGPEGSGAELLRWNAVFTYARRYRISMELARLVHDIALDEGIEPELAFRLVRLESRFDPTVVSHAGAVGLTQVMVGTARHFQPGITAEELTDPATNLRIGFRYLRGLVREHRGDLRLALLTYNRGPVAVQAALANGEDPANGYERVVMRGYRGRGVID
jgi:soluble lytic murein transglycosylase-like protein